jgi:hypothetical protein
VLRSRKEDYPAGHFGPEHGLTPEQAWVADKLSAKKQLERPFEGFQFAMRVGGIVSAIKRGLVGDSRWGREMLAKRGGHALARQAPQHLNAISQRGVFIRQANRDMHRQHGDRYR